MKVTVAIDSFKGSLSTFEAGEAAKCGILKAYPDAEVTVMPLADGGEGTVQAIVYSLGGELVRISVHGPLDTPVNAEYGYIEKTKTAVIEMAAASGITLISPEERNPLYTTTYGVGELILDAMKRGARTFIIGIGGSATNDGGVGMLEALGFDFLDSHGAKIRHGAIGLRDLAEISIDRVEKSLYECEFLVACDVKNTLLGDNGCSAVYGPQKGATPEMIKDMDGWLRKYAELTKSVFPEANENAEGTGAAGGLGFALLSYLGASMKSGVDLVIDTTGLEEKIKDSDVVVTGEGRLDGQSYMGKAPIGVAKIAKKYGKKTVAFSGCVTEDAGLCNAHGIDAFFPILRKPSSLEEAMNIDNAKANLSATAEQVFRLIKACDN